MLRATPGAFSLVDSTALRPPTSTSSAPAETTDIRPFELALTRVDREQYAWIVEQYEGRRAMSSCQVAPRRAERLHFPIVVKTEENTMCATGPVLPPADSALARYWDKPVSELVQLDVQVAAGQQERHRIFLLLLMALVHAYWNGFKRGRKGRYPWNDVAEDRAGPYEYKGHNIAAIAVDRRGRVLDFGFNHNKLFNSSAEHAEARLVRRVFSLAHIAGVYDEIETEDPDSGRRLGEYDTLSEVTIYTSLESCAQCAGMMALGNVKQVVYLQTDPGMYKIGNILRNLSERMPRAPLPISAEQVGFAEYQKGLEDAYARFESGVEKTPFWESEESDAIADRDGAISSFLCTRGAREHFRRGSAQFLALAEDASPLTHPDECSRDRDGNIVPRSLTNVKAVANAKRFYDYAVTNGRRGTPHSA